MLYLQIVVEFDVRCLNFVVKRFGRIGTDWVSQVIPNANLAPPRSWRNSIHPRNLTSLFRYLFPRTHRRLSDRLLGFHLDTFPRWKVQAQSRIYKLIVKAQRRRRERHTPGRGIFRLLRSKGRIPPSRLHSKHASSHEITPLATEQMTSQGWSDSRVPGARRQRMLGYIRAANELRQTYQAQLSTRLQNDDYTGDMPGAFPDADIVRSGDEEMLLFPSYARKHTKQSAPQSNGHRDIPGAREHIDHPHSGDAEYWRREWQRYEDENAIVDVDVRGWIYSPQKGPLNRKNRLLIAVARRLSGIPAPDTSPGPSRDSSQHRYGEGILSQEEEAAAREADLIARRGQREVEAASQGNYSADTHSVRGSSPNTSRSSSPAPQPLSQTNTGADLTVTDSSGLSSTQKRQSWNSSASLSREELHAANELLMSRLRPFMTVPLANTPITIFFFNDSKSQSKSVYTDESGHFKVRAALEFVPNKIRVLASETLSATEDVIVTEPTGVSLISDIDDTIKHSAIASGAREIFKNTFIRELGDLTIEGVKEWYSKLADLGVQLHYVSNSPWQLYPLLRSFFKMSGLPPGSFHLKQYTGMLQGIFEPAAERKKGSLDRIMQDFPERKFILVGDSGEADLEVYTDVVLDHPGRVLGVFIRDVTTPGKSNFFDSARTDTAPRVDSGQPQETLYSSGGWDGRHNRPALPSRPKPPSVNKSEEDLIDFSDEPDTLDATKSTGTDQNDEFQEQQQNGKASLPSAPNRPTKPSNLRSFATASPSITPTNHDRISTATHPADNRRVPPPKPRRSSTTVSVGQNVTPEQFKSQVKVPPTPPAPRNSRPLLHSRTPSNNTAAYGQSTAQEEGYVASARRQITSAYNSLPTLRGQSPDRTTGRPAMAPRGLSSYPAAAARWATGASGGDPAAGGDGGAPGQPYDRKHEIWKRRWLEAERTMKQKGVVLKTWRVGSDVMDDCIRLVEKAQRGINESERELDNKHSYIHRYERGS